MKNMEKVRCKLQNTKPATAKIGEAKNDKNSKRGANQPHQTQQPAQPQPTQAQTSSSAAVTTTTASPWAVIPVPGEGTTCTSTPLTASEPASEPASERAGLGLKNEVGERNCFINVVIQSMWHLRAFRDGFLALQSEPSDANEEGQEALERDDKNAAADHVLAALKGVFTAYQKAEEP